MRVRLLVTEAFVAGYSARLDALAEVGRGLDLCVLGPTAAPGTDGEAAFFSPDEYPVATAKLLVTALKATSLKWFHTMSAGVDNPVFTSFLDRGTRLTTSSGAAAIPIAQNVVSYLLALSRRLPETLRNQSLHRWDRLMGVDLAGSCVVIAGMGPIGCEVARLCTALRMRPIGLRRTVAGDEPCETWTLDRWHESLTLADHVVLALPLTESTRGMLDAPALALLRPHALVVNVGRGELIDELSLIRALTDGLIAGAGLDVFATEPLPVDSPLWDMSNVIITPHSTSLVPSTRAAMCESFLDNLGRYLRDQPLKNEVVR
jgi:D-2-hydroxyacid dehydrogenase (NADP+)